MPPESEKTIGRYQVLELLGEGGMGLVYKAYDQTLQRNVAIKQLHAQFAGKSGSQERFIQEARTAARLDHPGIVKVHDSGVHEEQYYIVMEFLPGDNLGQLLHGLRATRQWIPMTEAVGLVAHVALALDYAHRQGVLHRDIKPENIMFKAEPADGLPYRPVITDLGLARLAEGGMLTQEGTTMGTPAYMSPEQAQGQDCDARSDVYSLGILLYELCTGQPPFRPRNLMEAIHCHTKEQPAAPRTVRPGLPAGLEAIILKAMQKEREARYPSAAALAQALAGQRLPENSEQGNASSLGETVSLVTAHQANVPRKRGISLVEDFERAFASSEKTDQDTIQIMGEDITSRSVPVSKNTLTAGRDTQCDLYLNSHQISRQHARIMRREGIYKVVDLNSTNGTFLNDVRLLPGVPEEWSEEKLLRLGDFYLRLVRSAPTPVHPARAGGGQTEVAARGESPTEPDPQTLALVKIWLENDSLYVRPGESVSTLVHLTNLGALVDHFALKVEGLQPEWVTHSQERVQLFPGKEETVALTIRPPRVSSSRAGPHPFRVSIAGLAVPAAIARCEATLTIAPYVQYSSEMHPEIFPSGKHSRLTITNQGNRPESYHVQWHDPGEELVFHPAQAVVQVDEGRAVATEFHAEPHQVHWFGQERPYRFTAEISTPEAGLKTHSGEFISRARISTPLLVGLVSLVVLLACGLAGMALFLPNWPFPAVPTEILPKEARVTLPVVVPPVPETADPATQTALPDPTATSWPTNTSPAPVVANFGGVWQTNFAEINFSQKEGDQVSGEYHWYGSDTQIPIRGVVEGSTLHGTVGSSGVEFTFHLAGDEQQFDGYWLQNDQRYDWCGVRSGPLPAGCGFSGHWNTISDQTPPEQPTAELEQIGSQLRGTFFNGTSHGTLEGTLGAAGRGSQYRVDGLYTVNGFTGRFLWTLKDFNSMQFQGIWQNNEGQYAWCGWRESSIQPDPCFKGD